MIVLSLAWLVACSNEIKDTAAESSFSVSSPVSLKWGGWELDTTFIEQSDSCLELGANGIGITQMTAEIDLADPADITIELGVRRLTGARHGSGFNSSSFETIPVDNSDGYGIGVELIAEVSSDEAFTGVLTYEFNSTRGYCRIELDVQGTWLYHEQPPPCTS